MSPISSFFVVLSLGLSIGVFGQLPNLPRTYLLRGGRTIGIYKGIVVAKDGYMAEGEIEVQGARACRVSGMRILYRDIRRMRLYDIYDSTVFTDLINIHKGWRFWQFRAGADSAGVVDNGVSGENGSRMFLFNGRRRVKVYGSWTFYMHYMYIAPLLLAFIQKYYPEDYPRFGTAVLVYPPAAEMEMIRYLAGKAGEPGR